MGIVRLGIGMPTVTPVAPRTPCQKGFTLIEILIVILIISIISGVAALTISRNQQKQYEYLANHLAQIIRLAEEEAMLRSVILGLAFTSSSFQFYEYHNKVSKNVSHWQPMTEKVFGLQRFNKNTEVTLLVQNQKRELNGQPQIIISSSGDISPFIILLGKKEQRPSYQVVGYVSGNIISRVFHEE